MTRRDDARDEDPSMSLFEAAPTEADLDAGDEDATDDVYEPPYSDDDEQIADDNDDAAEQDGDA